MKGIIVSKNTLTSNLGTDTHGLLVATLQSLHSNEVRLITISKDPKPSNFDKHFPYIEFVHKPNRQSSGVARSVLVERGCDVNMSFVLATSDSDIIMAANSKIFSLVALWSDRLEAKTKHGMGIKKPDSLGKILEFLDGTNPWFSIAEYNNDLKIFSLTNAGDFNSLPELAGLTKKLSENLKLDGNTYHNVFRFLLVSSILKTPELQNVNYWGFYPSSKPKTWTDEIIYKYYEYAKYASTNTAKKEAIFIRIKDGPKRSLGEGGNRLDPNNQLDSIVINPYYKGKLTGKKIAILDDFATNGTSFWVAYSLLKKAGASEVICVAMGKFGRKLKKYEIDLSLRDPYSEAKSKVTYTIKETDSSIYFKAALSELKEKMKEFL